MKIHKCISCLNIFFFFLCSAFIITWFGKSLTFTSKHDKILLLHKIFFIIPPLLETISAVFSPLCACKRYCIIYELFNSNHYTFTTLKNYNIHNFHSSPNLQLFLSYNEFFLCVHVCYLQIYSVGMASEGGSGSGGLVEWELKTRRGQKGQGWCCLWNIFLVNPDFLDEYWAAWLANIESTVSLNLLSTRCRLINLIINVEYSCSQCFFLHPPPYTYASLSRASDMVLARGYTDEMWAIPRLLAGRKEFLWEEVTN